MKYTIDRSKWVCGGSMNMGSMGLSGLLNEKGRMCCLGQICSQSGVSDEILQYQDYPRHVKYSLPDTLAWLTDSDNDDSNIAREMAGVNDAHGTTQRERESELRKLARKAGHTLVFKGTLLPKS